MFACIDQKVVRWFTVVVSESVYRVEYTNSRNLDMTCQLQILELLDVVVKIGI